MSTLRLVQCLLCKKECQLVEGQRGDCRVRINIGGKLTSLVYGKPCAVHIDPVEKKPLFHVLPGSRAFSLATAGCNLHCKFCQNWEISQREPEETVNQDLPPPRVIEAAVSTNCRSIAYTYSDPIVFYEYTYDTSKLAHKRGIKNILVTAGYINREPLLELCEYTDAANVDLKGFTEDYYKKICGAELQPVLDTLKTMQSQGVWLEITNLVVPTLNDDLELIGKMCDWILDNLGPEVPLHFSRFWPMYRLKNLAPTSPEIITGARELAINRGLHYVYVGNIPGHAGNNTYCPKCKEIVIGRIGYNITRYDMRDGKCGHCDFKLAGVWE